MTKLQNFIQCQRGATAMEYVLIASGIALAISVAVFALGDGVSTFYDGLATAIIR